MSGARTLRVLLTIKVEALQGDDLEEAGFFEGMEDADPEELTNLIIDYDPRELGELLPGAITHPDSEMFAGSGLFVKFSDVAVVKSEWAE